LGISRNCGTDMKDGDMDLTYKTPINKSTIKILQLLAEEKTFGANCDFWNAETGRDKLMKEAQIHLAREILRMENISFKS
jgi:hypothetical protein